MSVREEEKKKEEANFSWIEEFIPKAALIYIKIKLWISWEPQCTEKVKGINRLVSSSSKSTLLSFSTRTAKFQLQRNK